MADFEKSACAQGSEILMVGNPNWIVAQLSESPLLACSWNLPAETQTIVLAVIDRAARVAEGGDANFHVGVPATESHRQATRAPNRRSLPEHVLLQPALSGACAALGLAGSVDVKCGNPHRAQFNPPSPPKHILGGSTGWTAS